jgi:uncharacterized OB-fold protein
MATLFCEKCGTPIRPERMFKPCTNCGERRNKEMVKFVLRGFVFFGCIAVVLLVRLIVWGPF